MAHIPTCARFEGDAYYLDGDLQVALKLSSATLRRARRDGALRFVRRGRSVLYLGSWIRAWLEGDRQAAATAEAIRRD
jgi:hypothetical protein